VASITSDKATGRRTIQFMAGDGRRKSIRLGKCSMRTAESVRIRIEELHAASLTGYPPSREVSRWLSSLDDGLYSRIAAVGLAPRRASMTLSAFIDDYIKARSDVKPSTTTIWKRTKRHLIDYFGADRGLRSITAGDAERWRLSLIEKGLADNTVRRTCGLAKQFFAAAVRHRLIDENPFSGLVAAVRANRSRYHFVSREDAVRVLDACPDAEWRMIFALARYGGLRVPSEILALRWTDIDWERNRFLVTSPKTEHHDGQGSRIVPLFPELRLYMLAAFEASAEGSTYCVTRYRDGAVNLRTQLQRIIGRAGLKPWPKLWQNLRSTRETELANDFPAHVATAWIGNSVAVANKHYLQVTEDHFSEAVQNPVQQVHVDPRSDPQDARDEESKTALAPPARKQAALRAGEGPHQVGATGLEPVTSSM